MYSLKFGHEGKEGDWEHRKRKENLFLGWRDEN
jgi:hypothetical protein